MYSLLIVDDEPLTRQFMKSNISSINPAWTVAGEAEDGGEALAFLEGHDVDLVITDIKMPEMDGLVLCEKIKASKPGQEIIILSGFDEFSFAQEAMKHKVQGYLLKPIKIDELRYALLEAEKQISAAQVKESAYRTLIDLSSDYESHVCRSYLRAIISNSNTEIKVFHPLTYKLKIDLIQAKSTIMILMLDVESLMEQRIPCSDLTIFKYILLQTAKEIAEKDKPGTVFLDAAENVVVYVTDEGAMEAMDKCERVYREVSAFFMCRSGITVTGGIGSPRSDVLEMAASYQEASDALSQWVVAGGNRLYSSQQADPAASVQADRVQKSCNSVVTALMEGNETALRVSVKNYVNAMGSLSMQPVLRHGLLLLDTLKSLKRDFGNEQYDLCLRQLFRFASTPLTAISPNETSDLYLNALQLAGSKPAENCPEQLPQKLVKDVKDYIYNNFAEPISLSQIAETLCVSPNYLSKIFHEMVGESYIKFLTRIRMEYAAKLLKTDPHGKISAIAEKSGYYNLKHFNFVFKECYNMTPREYQKT